MNYQQTLDFLYSSLPMFQRIGDSAVKKDLTNIRKLCHILGHPENAFPCVHIAGTNGKGSTSHMLASIFQAAGFKTGLYTSPHYVDFRERIRINGQKIGKKQVMRFVEQYASAWKNVQPSFFEITVAMAFDHFRQEMADIVILETGLGGRLDSTNVVTPMMSVITNIGFDHVSMLGDTLPKIAGEKAGIIKRGVPVVIGEWRKETAPVFLEKARQEEAPIWFASRHIRVRPVSQKTHVQTVSVVRGKSVWMEGLTTDLTGPFQQQNLKTVLEAIWRWNLSYPHLVISEKHIRKGLREVKASTGMIGRWMILQRHPMVITDASHNPHGMKAILPALLSIQARHRHFVLGFVQDKEIGKILPLFPKTGTYYWCCPDIPRGKPAHVTATEARTFGLHGIAFRSVKTAYHAALKAARQKDVIFVGGSSYVVGDLLK